MSIVRKHRLYKLGIKQSDEFDAIFKYLDRKLKGLREFSKNEKDSSVYFINNTGQYLFRYYYKNNIVYVRDFDFFEYFETYFFMKKENIYILMKEIFESIIKKEVNNMYLDEGSEHYSIEEKFKMEFNLPRL